MKYLLFALFFGFSQISFADLVPYTENEGFSKWHHIETFKELINTIPDDKYPAIIQGGALLGDDVAYRVLFGKKPGKNFKYKFTYGVTEDRYEDLHHTYTQNGFILVHMQTVQLMAIKSYQAVWVKNDL